MTDDARVTYALDGGVATITMDDGKANAQSPAMLAELHAAVDRAVQDEAVIVLRGRPGVFSGGYDLKVFQSGDGDAVIEMLRQGGRLVSRLLGHPRPVLAACTGHGVAQGAFMLAACDVRIGLRGSFQYGMNEVAIGLAVPRYAVALCQHRLPAPVVDLALGTARMVDVSEAHQWGLLDAVADTEGSFDLTVAAEAERLAGLVPEAVTETRRRVRGDLPERILALTEEEFPLLDGTDEQG